MSLALALADGLTHSRFSVVDEAFSSRQMV